MPLGFLWAMFVDFAVATGNLPRQIESFPQGQLITVAPVRFLAPLLPMVWQNKCRNSGGVICLSTSHCCRRGDVCCPHGCCPSTHGHCDLDRHLCIDNRNLTLCLDPGSNSTFSGTACARGGCCGRDSRFPYCPIAGPPLCVNAHGFFPCAINSTAKPGVPCGNDTCCPDPLRCCGNRCCNDGKGGPVPLETVAYSVTLGHVPHGISPSPSSSRPSLESMNWSDEARPSFVVVKPSRSPSPAANGGSAGAAPPYPPFPSNPSSLPLPIPHPDFFDGSSSSYSVSSPASPNPRKPSHSSARQQACFPASAYVHTPDSGTLRMEELRTGDEVVVRPGKYSRIFMWTHNHRSSERGHAILHLHDFVRLTVATGETLTASPGHYVYTCNFANGQIAIGPLLTMDSVKTRSHSLCAVHKDRIASVPVTKVERVQGHGLFNPHTLDGNIVVNGFMCSCYTSIVNSRTAHGLLAPLRAASRYADSIVAFFPQSH